MTLDELIAAAKEQLASTDPTDGHLAADHLAKGVIELLGEAEPCGAIEPDVVPPPGDGTHGVVVLHEDTAGVYAPWDARSVAVMLLQAADEATAK